MKSSTPPGGYVPSGRGNLYFLNFSDLPFIPKRVFTVNGVPESEVRGGHAHYVCEQVLVCVKGRIEVITDNGIREERTVLGPGDSLYHSPLEWAELCYFDDAELLSICSHEYDSKDYINDHDLFLREVRKG